MFDAKKFLLRKTLIVCLLLILCVNNSSDAENSADDFWWENDTLIAAGFGLTPLDENNAAKAKLIARKAARSDAYRMLAEQAGEIKITSTKNVQTKEISAVIKSAKIISEAFDDEYGIYTVVMSVPIYGVKNSIASAIFKRVDKEDFPAPTVDEPIETEGHYTGLVIDCGDLEINPVLAPVIRNEDNQAVYSYNHLDYDKAIAKGVVGFIKKDADDVTHVDDNMILLGADENISRAGDNPLVIKVKALDDDDSCPVISTADANKILIENQASHFLNNGSVVFMSNRIRGLRAE